ncbi:hypothetical protein WJX81_007604 [Elliptochloris bilobata]|uniref:Uncharacterized protein n=1 Tax=Elliptochloris bilobata TaxID=381761 RepID=A0AAW1RG11_9CHLO
MRPWEVAWEHSAEPASGQGWRGCGAWTFSGRSAAGAAQGAPAPLADGQAVCGPMRRARSAEPASAPAAAALQHRATKRRAAPDSPRAKSAPARAEALATLPRRARPPAARRAACTGGQFGALEREGRAFMEAAGLSADALLNDLLAMSDSITGAA